MKVKVEKINGHSGEDWATSVFSKRIAVEGENLGTIVGVFLVSKAGGEPSQILHDLFDHFCKKFESSDDGILARLDSAKVALGEHVKSLDLEGSFGVCLFFRDAAYIVRIGNDVRVHVFRAPNSYEIKFESGSGHALDGELFLVGTSKFFSTFDVGIFAKEGLIDFEGIIDGLATDISAEGAQSQIGAAFVQIEAVGEEKKQVDEAAGGAAHAREVVQPPASENVDADVAVSVPSDGEPVLVMPTERKVRPNPIGIVFNLLVREVSKLRGGDIGAKIRLRRNVVILAGVVLLILAISAIWTISAQMNHKKDAEFRVQMDDAGSKYSEATSILELNRDRARSLLVEAQKSVRDALSVKPKDSQAVSLASQIDQKLKDSENAAGVSLKTFYEADAQAVGLAKSGDSIMVFEDKQITEVAKDGKKLNSYGSFEQALGGAVWDKSLFVLTNTRVIKVGRNKEKDVDVAAALGGQDIGLFLGNVYILVKNQINKFVPVDSGYSKSADYLEKSGNFSADSKMAIDGSIWVSSGGDIFKYTRGKQDDFKISGLVGASTNFGEIYTDTDSSKIYVIDRANSALLVIGKDGVYQKSYQAKEFGQAKSLLVDEAAGKMYINSGSRVLVAEL